jgi:hypothetical protein
VSRRTIIIGAVVVLVLLGSRLLAQRLVTPEAQPQSPSVARREACLQRVATWEAGSRPESYTTGIARRAVERRSQRPSPLPATPGILVTTVAVSDITQGRLPRGSARRQRFPNPPIEAAPVARQREGRDEQIAHCAEGEKDLAEEDHPQCYPDHRNEQRRHRRADD